MQVFLVSSDQGPGKIYSIVVASLLGAMISGAIMPASAQVLEEIVVTAQKREQSSQDVGIAITSFTGAQMKALGIEKSFEIASYAPGVHISGNLAGQNTQFSIRGVTQNDFNDVIEAPNAVYLDEGYIAVAQAQTFAVFDIERVEILKGPQSTLFGRNATGGLIHYFSRKPNFDRAEGYLETTYGRFESPAHADQIRLEAAATGPLGAKAAVRLAVMYNWHEGYLKNLYPDSAFGGPPAPGAGADLGTDNTIAGRGTLAFRPTQSLDVSLSFNIASSDLATGPYQSKPTIGVFDAAGELIDVIDVAPGETRLGIAADGSDFGSDLDNDGNFEVPGTPTAVLPCRVNASFACAPGGDFFGYRDPDGNDFTFSGDFAFEDSGRVDVWGVNGRIEWDLGEGTTLTAVTDFKDYEKLLFIDVDSAPVNQLANYAGVDATSFTQELRIAGQAPRSRWLLGLYFLNIDTDSDNGLKAPANGVVPGAPVDIGVDARLRTNSYSAFGQVEYDLAPRLTAIIGARIIEEEKDYHFEQNFYFGNQDPRTIHQGTPVLVGPVNFDPVTFSGEAFDAKTSDTLWAGNAQLDFRPNDDLLIYAGVRRGVKAGSFNAHLFGGLPIPASAIPYDEEVLWSYEAGFKSTLWNGRARLNGTVFYYDYNDYQAFLFTGVGGVVINADAETVGAELELQASPGKGWDALISLAWFDAEVKDVPLRVNGPISRNVDPVYAPEFQISGLLRYEWAAFGGAMSVLGDFSYSAEYFYNLRNFTADKFDGYLMLNARLGWISRNGEWELAFKITNLTDERAGIQGFDLATLCGCNEISYQPPRWYGLTLKHNF